MSIQPSLEELIARINNEEENQNLIQAGMLNVERNLISLRIRFSAIDSPEYGEEIQEHIEEHDEKLKELTRSYRTSIGRYKDYIACYKNLQSTLPKDTTINNTIITPPTFTISRSLEVEK